MEWTSLGRVLIGVGLLLCALGVLVMLLEKVGLGWRPLPGDILYRRGNFVFFFPLATSLLLSLLLSLLFLLLRGSR